MCFRRKEKELLERIDSMNTSNIPGKRDIITGQVTVLHGRPISELVSSFVRREGIE